MIRSESAVGDGTTQSEKRIKLDVAELQRLGESRFSGVLNFFVGCSEQDNHHLVVEKVNLHYHPPAGYVSRLRLIVNEEWKYYLQVLLSSTETGQLGCTEDFIQLCKRMVEGEYKFCPGIDPEIYDKEFYAKIKYHSKNVLCSKIPFNRVASIKCPLYHKLAKNASLVEKAAAEVQCAACKRLVHDLRQLVAKKVAISPRRKASWVQPSSHFKMKYLSPASLQKRKQLIKQERARDKRIVEQYNRTRLTLDDEQHDEVCGIINSIENTHKDELEKVLGEADKEGAGESIREMWKIDSQKAKKHFQDDQKKK